MTAQGHGTALHRHPVPTVCHQTTTLDYVLTPAHFRTPGRHPTCYTFGSPPVLAHEQGGGGHRALQALGLPTDCVQNFVLENDPVPRAMLSVDPTFEMLKEWSAVKGLLQLRGLLAGEGSPLSPGRFLFETVGQVQLIKWSAEGEGAVKYLYDVAGC